MRPVNLALRFALELAALAAFATFGLHAIPGSARFALAAAVVLAAAAVWGRWVALGVTGRSVLGVALTVAAVANAGLLRGFHHTLPSGRGRA
jgi:uncharacterized protein DUF2568